MKPTKTLFVMFSSLVSSAVFSAGSQSALMNALTSPQAGMYASGDKLLEIFVQNRDGASTVRNIEALDTIYFITNTGIKGEDQTNKKGDVLIAFQIDKTSSHLGLISYKALVDVPLGTVQLDPTTLPDINFQWAWKQITIAAGAEYKVKPQDLVLARIGIARAVYPEKPLVISFDFKPKDYEGDTCWEWIYAYDDQDIFNSGFTVGCWFMY